jgi:large-conductance mechanosensitive channel
MNIWIFSFLYFPEDKTAYLPAAIEFTIFAIICILVFRWIVKKSRKQEEQTKELEERILRERQKDQK